MILGYKTNFSILIFKAKGMCSATLNLHYFLCLCRLLCLLLGIYGYSLFLAFSCNGDYELEGMVMEKIDELAKGVLQDKNIDTINKKGMDIPEDAIKFTRMDNASLKNKAGQVLHSDDKDPVITMMNKKPSVKDFQDLQNHQMFKSAKAVWINPEKILSDIFREFCGKKNHDMNKNIYTKRIVKEKSKEVDFIEKRCIAPTPKIECESSLKLRCDYNAGTRECFPGITRKKGKINYKNNLIQIEGDSELCVGKYTKDQAEGGGKYVDSGNCKRKIVFEFELKQLEKVDLFQLDTLEVKNSLVVFQINGKKVDISYNDESTTLLNANQKGNESTDAEIILNGKKAVASEVRKIFVLENIDLKEYLKIGKNTVSIEYLTYALDKPLKMKIEAKFSCCNSILEDWDKRCWVK